MPLTSDTTESQTFPVQLSSILLSTSSDEATHASYPRSEPLTPMDSTKQTVSPPVIYSEAASLTSTIPSATLVISSTTNMNANGAFTVPGLPIGSEALPTNIPLKPASSAMVHCASISGGIQVHGGIDKGCANLFTHVATCFSFNGPWSSPYDDARNKAFRTCVCMTSDDIPFTQYSALWKNFTGCVACVHDSVEFDTIPWMTLEARRLWDFCRAQQPNAFLFEYFLRNWYDRLSNYSSSDDSPFASAFDGGVDDGGMQELRQQYTGRPPLANLPWGPSAPPSGQFADVKPLLTDYITTIVTQGDFLTMPASKVVTWVPMKASETWQSTAASVQEAAAVDELLSSALCLGEYQTGCQINRSVRAVKAWPLLWLWLWALALSIFGAAAML